MTQIKRVTRLDAESQWAVSRGDLLFRDALYRNGFKTGESPTSPGGWRCYITDIAKSAVIVKAWQALDAPKRDETFDCWAPVLNYEMRVGSPKLIVLMGDKTRSQFNRLRLAGRIPIEPPTVQVTHYAFRRQSAEGRAAYHREFDAVARIAATLNKTPRS